MSRGSENSQYAALLAQERFVRAFFEESSVGLNLCRMDGHWLESNRAFLDIIGYAADEADDGKLTYWQLTPRKYDAQEAEQLARLSATGKYGPYEKEFIRKDGSLVPVRLNGFVIEVGGEKMIWSFIEDLSSQRELETERLKAIHGSKLAALGEMAASIAHEINTPLAIISAFAFTLPGSIAAGDQALITEALTEIQRAVERAGAITAGLRRLSRGTAKSAFEPVELKTVITEAMGLAAARTRAEGLVLELDLKTTAMVQGNGVQLLQVLLNLVNNAVDAVKGAAIRQLAVRARDEGAFAEVIVEDTGPGIAPEHAGRLFDRFFTTKEPDEGTGLGLSISRDIVQSMHGTLTWDRVGDRTRFMVRLPRMTPAGAPS
ncbi:MAG: ATP-binding protein [Myxococcales bacterium]|nr:ATP-binding protein [Myxococcales bacterium]